MITLPALLLAAVLTPAPATSLPSVSLAHDPASSSSAVFALAGGDPLTIECPPIAKFACGASTDPDATGHPTVSGGCDRTPLVTYTDLVVPPPTCNADRFDSRILRTWTVTDSCGNSASCTQRLDIVKVSGYLDIKPQSCPNPFNLGGNGVVQMSILGTATFDVHSIDPASIQIWTLNCAGGPVTPISWGYEDTGTPYTGGANCTCHALGGDGFTDLRLKFNKSSMETGLGLANYPQWSFVKIFVSAKLDDGCGLVASDCVRIQ